MFPKKLDLLLTCLSISVFGHLITAQVTLTHNVGEIVPSTHFSCSPTFTGRTFTLQDFGISEDEELTINAVEIAYQIKIERELGAWITFYVYAIDDNFPASFSRTTNTLLGKSQLVQLETSPTNNGLTPLKTLTANFNIPVTVPPNTKRILVEVEGRLSPNSLFLASTEGETDSTWFNGGCPPYTYDTTDNYGYPDAHSYLKVFGTARIPSGCSVYPVSGAALLCDPDGDGFIQLDASHVGSSLRGYGKVITLYDSQGSQLPYPLPNPYTNTVPYEEVITIRATDTINGGCQETTFTLRTVDPFNIEQPPDLYACDDGNGHALFDVSSIEGQIIREQTGLNVSYLDAHGNELSNFPSASYRNQNPHSQTVYVKVTPSGTHSEDPQCYEDTFFNLIVRPRPQAHALNDLVVQDNDGDGFAEFDTSDVERAVVGSQTGVDVSYFDMQGLPLPYPLANPYTNMTPNLETITVRVSDPVTGCFAETALSLRVTSQPTLGIPSDFYACDEGNGLAHFDVSSIETQIIGTQTGLNVSYLDTNGKVLQDFPSASYRNQEPYSQTVTASVTDDSDPTFRAETTFDLIVNPMPVAHALPDLIMCDNDGFSEFDTSGVEGLVVGNQTGMEVTYYDAQGAPIPSPLPNPYTNMVPHLETITVRVSDPRSGCYSQTLFKVVVRPQPVAMPLNDLVAQDDNSDGFAEFDTSSIESMVVGNQTGVEVSYMDSLGYPLPYPLPNPYTNTVPHLETISVRVTDPLGGCYDETPLNFSVLKPPTVGTPPDLYACDEGNGFAQFDVSSIKQHVIDSQSGLSVTYLDTSGHVLPNFPSTSYRNQEPYSQTVTVSVMDDSDPTFHAETTFDLIVNPLPVVHALPDLIVCDDDGIAEFDTSKVEGAVVGNQTGMEVSYFDAQGSTLPYPLPNPYTNTVPHLETITVRVTNPRTGCYSETSFNLIVIQPPVIDLQETYYLCDQELSRIITAAPDADSWTWVADDGTILSHSPEAILTNEGKYTLSVTKAQNGISCESSVSFRLVRTAPVSIHQVDTGADFSNNNYIKILATGDGDLEYSIDGLHYQEHDLFQALPGGIYTVYARDRDGCGQDSREVVLLDYPRFFSPNNDGINDHWKIEALKDFPDAVVRIHDRYGKLLGQIQPEDIGWDGTFKGNPLPSSDYWFTLDLGDGREYKNHFTLKR